MDIFSGLVGLALFVIAGVLLILSGIGVFAICIVAWRRFTNGAAASHVARERQRAKAQLKRERRIAAEREEAMLKGVSAVSNKLVRTIVESHMQHLADREADHRQQIIQLAYLLDRNQDRHDSLLVDAQRFSCDPLEELPTVAAPKQQPRSQRLTSLVRHIFFR